MYVYVYEQNTHLLYIKTYMFIHTTLLLRNVIDLYNTLLLKKIGFGIFSSCGIKRY